MYESVKLLSLAVVNIGIKFASVKESTVFSSVESVVNESSVTCGESAVEVSVVSSPDSVVNKSVNESVNESVKSLCVAVVNCMTTSVVVSSVVVANSVKEFIVVSAESVVNESVNESVKSLCVTFVN